MYVFLENSCLMMVEYRLYIWQIESNRFKLFNIQRFTNDLYYYFVVLMFLGISGQLVDLL